MKKFVFLLLFLKDASKTKTQNYKITKRKKEKGKRKKEKGKRQKAKQTEEKNKKSKKMFTWQSIFSPSFFLILGIVFLTIGIVCNMFLSKFKEQNERIQGMFELVNEMLQEIENIRSQTQSFSSSLLSNQAQTTSNTPTTTTITPTITTPTTSLETSITTTLTSIPNQQIKQVAQPYSRIDNSISSSSFIKEEERNKDFSRPTGGNRIVVSDDEESFRQSEYDGDGDNSSQESETTLEFDDDADEDNDDEEDYDEDEDKYEYQSKEEFDVNKDVCIVNMLVENQNVENYQISDDKILNNIEMFNSLLINPTSSSFVDDEIEQEEEGQGQSQDKSRHHEIFEIDFEDVEVPTQTSSSSSSFIDEKINTYLHIPHSFIKERKEQDIEKSFEISDINISTNDIKSIHFNHSGEPEEDLEIIEEIDSIGVKKLESSNNSNFSIDHSSSLFPSFIIATSSSSPPSLSDIKNISIDLFSSSPSSSSSSSSHPSKKGSSVSPSSSASSSYSSLTLQQLKQLVSEKQLAKNISKLKKQELIDILEAHSK